MTRPQAQRAERALDGDERAPGEARRFVREHLGFWECDGLIESATLVVSELVTNAVLHGHSDCRVRLTLGPEALRIEVEDEGPGEPEVQPVDIERFGGRGLLLVSAVSERWGIEHLEVGGKVVWAELAR